MMPTDDLLRAQLVEAFAERGDALEVAALAGSLARFPGALDDEPAMRSFCATLTLEEVMAMVETAVDAFVEAEEDDEPAETWDVLCALDEVCAAAAWLGFGEAAQGAVDLAVRVVLAFPETWAAHSDPAVVLLASCAPLAGDPSRPLWEAIAAAPSSALELA